ncbi:MAG: GH92 family glycosyl hydrolase [Chitinophagaceae bacterium]|nr:GH92 family glycosyl hydrolase [Chitinophagaceae bacterium]
MKYKQWVLTTLFLFSLVSLSNHILLAQKNYTQYVDPLIGTGGHGHTYPGAVLPHGMVQLSPDTRLDGWDGCGGYHYSDNYIYGFTHTHLSGTGVSDYGDILLMPMTGEPTPDNKVYGSKFSHANEKANAGFYSVKLEDENILAELTTTTRVGLHRYTFSGSDKNNVILDLKHRDEVIESSLKIINIRTIAGLRRSKAWATNQYVYFVIEFSKPFINAGFWRNDTLLSPDIKDINNAKNIKAFFEFENETVMAKVAISAVSIEGAQNNLAKELPGWDFEKTKAAAENIWNRELGRIDVESNDEKKLRTFYTALYHTAIVPNINQDVDGQYRSRDNQIHTATGFTNYSVFSLWDTYRGAHPLYTIIDRERTLDYIRSFLIQYRQGGRLPVWELSSNETDCMIGYHSVPVIVDAYMKGINGFDTTLALEAMKKSATWNHLGLPALMDHGLLEMDDEHESVSKTLEYAYDDWCIAQFAKALGKEEDYNNYIKRAQAFKNIFDVQTGFMRPRKNGNWLSPFDPREVNNNFTEANSWQYSFYTPQDINGYIEMIGGRKKMEDKLDQLFAANSQTTGRDQSDITGLIGQYAHGNEPSHHIAYLYNFTGAAYKTQAMVNRIMHEMYKDTPDGLEGNEDCGQMSAWYVLSALGFYPVTPGTTDYIIGTPLFSSATINLENGKKFTVKANKAGNADFYIQSASLNAVSHSRSYLTHQDINNGGNLSFEMGDKPSTFGLIDLPSTAITGKKIVLNPVIDGGAISFKGVKTIKISSAQKGVSYYYTMDGSLPTKASKKYIAPISIKESTTIKAIAIDLKGETSFITTAVYKKMPHNWTIKLNTLYEQQYDGGGPNGLIDGINGTVDWRKGNWQGYQKTDMDVLIDLQRPTSVSKVTIGFLQDSRAWIVMPKELIIEVSDDGKIFVPVYSGKNFLPIEDETAQVKRVVAAFTTVSTRYIRVKALQYGKLPAWQLGAGGDTHIFVDEINVR